MTVQVRLPDGRLEDFYSPSLVMHDHVRVGMRYTVADFTERSLHALGIASERVQAKFGFACTSAAASGVEIRTAAASFAPTDVVEVVAMAPPLPAPEQA